jgi:hypothetical protein
MTWVALLFTLCGADAAREDAPADACESGIIRHAECAGAEAYRDARAIGIRRGGRGDYGECGPVLHVHRCIVNPPPLAQLQGEP